MTIATAHVAGATTQRIEVIVLAVLVCLGIFELVRRKHLLERYAIVWLTAGVSVLVLGLWKGLLTTLSHAVGITYPPSALFVVTFLFVLVMLVNFSTTVSRLSDQNNALAQRLALLQRRLEEMQEGERGAEPPADGPTRSDAHEPANVSPARSGTSERAGSLPRGR